MSSKKRKTAPKGKIRKSRKHQEKSHGSKGINFDKNKKKLNSSINKKNNHISNTLIKWLFNILFYFITISLIASALLYAVSSKSNASIYGYRFYTVLTNSMVPIDKKMESEKIKGFYAGDIVVIHDRSYDQVNTGDVITYKIGDGSHFLTHRLMEKEEKKGILITKGDANKSMDPPVNTEQLIGKVVFVIPKMGLIMSFVKENTLLCLVFMLSVIGSFLTIKIYFFDEKKM